MYKYLIQLCLVCRGRVSVQQFRDGVVLRNQDVLWIDFTLFVRFFDRYYVATIPKSRFEILF